MPARITYRGRAIIGTVTNLSPGGAFIRCYSTIPVSSKFDITIDLGDDQAPQYVPLTGTVRHIRGGGLGVKFGTLSPSALLRIITVLVKIGIPGNQK